MGNSSGVFVGIGGSKVVSLRETSCGFLVYTAQFLGTQNLPVTAGKQGVAQKLGSECFGIFPKIVLVSEKSAGKPRSRGVSPPIRGNKLI